MKCNCSTSPQHGACSKSGCLCRPRWRIGLCATCRWIPLTRAEQPSCWPMAGQVSILVLQVAFITVSRRCQQTLPLTCSTAAAWVTQEQCHVAVSCSADSVV